MSGNYRIAETEPQQRFPKWRDLLTGPASVSFPAVVRGQFECDPPLAMVWEWSVLADFRWRLRREAQALR